MMESLLRAYSETPPMTRLFCTASVVVTLLVHLEVLTIYDIYFNPQLVFGSYQIWRPLTCFFYLGKIDLSFIFNIFFAYRHSYFLETSAFLDRVPDLVVMWVFGSFLILLMGWYAGTIFLHQSLTIMLIYVWSRRNPHVHMDLLGIIFFPAPYFPMLLIAFAYLFGSDPTPDWIGFWAGHVYYHLEYVFPEAPGGFKLLHPPQFLKNWVGVPEERPLEVFDETRSEPSPVPATEGQREEPEPALGEGQD